MLTGSVTVGATALPLVSYSLPIAGAALTLRAGGGNSGKVYVGTSSAVTAASDLALDGFELGAGQSLDLGPAAASDGSNVWLIGSGSGQKVFWLLPLAQASSVSSLGHLVFSDPYDSGSLPLLF